MKELEGDAKIGKEESKEGRLGLWRLIYNDSIQRAKRGLLHTPTSPPDKASSRGADVELRVGDHSAIEILRLKRVSNLLLPSCITRPQLTSRNLSPPIQSGSTGSC